MDIIIILFFTFIGFVDLIESLRSFTCYRSNCPYTDDSPAMDCPKLTVQEEKTYSANRSIANFLAALPCLLFVIDKILETHIPPLITITTSAVAISTTLYTYRHLKKIKEFIIYKRNVAQHYTEFTEADHQQYLRSRKDTRLYWLSLISSAAVGCFTILSFWN